MNDPLENMETTNGKLDSATLEEVFGIKQTNPFGTTDRQVFETRLSNISYAQMQNLANRLGLTSFASQPQLRKNLLRAFDEQNKIGKYLVPPVQPKQTRLDRNNPEHLKLMQQLGMGV